MSFLITGLWPLPNYTACRQKHVGVNIIIIIIINIRGNKHWSLETHNRTPSSIAVQAGNYPAS